MAAVIHDPQREVRKPELAFRIDGFGCDVNDAIFLPENECIVTGTEDRTLRVWMRRDTGRFWPSALEVLPSPVSSLFYCSQIRCVYAGLDNGTIMEFFLSEDLNHLDHRRDYLSHTARVCGIISSLDMKWIVTTSKDRTVAWYSSENGKRLGGHQLEAAGTCLEYDAGSHYLFVGDASGRVTLLSFTQSGSQGDCRVIRELCAHGQAVTCLSWDSANSRLFSCSADHRVILWDIGGAKGAAMELQSHTKEVTSVYWWIGGNSHNANGLTKNVDQYKGLAVSGGYDGIITFWFMDPGRMETPTWSDSDVCQICGTPFFWNVKKMWNIMSVGVRQHHCRRCGKAVCDKCSPYRSSLPAMGFERDVRMCNVCGPSITDEDRRSLAILFDARHPIVRLRVEENLKLLLTIGKDRVVKVWDIKSLA
ncbi:hypothetical protein EG68_10909 [Paragonimus skrjabini miyazakii]|uniref:FYVE-type domain-containing protein n=1 Tax=Paragonimus skrjabini miyazakii TaxID=59628 RepID=A0A8S9YBI5_9TREM|nr:hypothetical protein EG68_10909 [Paragonimus skrjabini miyazakii]